MPVTVAMDPATPKAVADYLQSVAAENTALRAVVEFYADPSNWLPRVTVGMDGVARVPTSRIEAAGHFLPAMDALVSCAPVSRTGVRSEVLR